VTTYAYLRVSTDRQDVANQRHGILEYANTHNLGLIQFGENALSSRVAWRERAIGQLLTATATAGDVVIFAEISRMALSTLHVLEMLEHVLESARVLRAALAPHLHRDWSVRAGDSRGAAGRPCCTRPTAGMP